MRHSSGTLLYRSGPDGIEVLIVHASGAYNKDAPWSIPKGLPDAGEDLESAARRETSEEAGVTPGKLISLGFVDMHKSNKRVHCFYGEAPADVSPKPVSWEVDKAEFVALDKARRLLHPAQAAFIDRLLGVLGGAKI